MKKILTIILAFMTLWSVTVPTLAVTDIDRELDSFKNYDDRFTLTTIDELGNEKTIIDIPTDKLRTSFDYFSIPSLPHPAKYASADSGINGFSDYMAAKPFPQNSNFLFIDLGANWQIEDSSINFYAAHGRYIYIYYGRYDEELDSVVTGDIDDTELNWGSDIYGSADSHWSEIGEYGNPDTYSLSVYGPFLVLNYNEQTDKMTILENTYDNNYGKHSLTMTGLTVDNDTTNPDYYARLVTWAAYSNPTSFQFSTDLVLNTYYTEFNWLSIGDSVNVSGGDASDATHWLDKLVEFGILDPESAAGKLLINAVTGIEDVINLIGLIPEFFSTVFSIFPEPMADFLGYCFTAIMGALLLRLALLIIRGG